MDKGTPTDLETLLLRFAEMEKEIASLKAENALLKAELARKDKFIAGLQQRLFGSSSEKIDPPSFSSKWTRSCWESPSLIRKLAARHPHRRRKNQAPKKPPHQG